MRASFLHGLPRNQVSKKPGHVQIEVAAQRVQSEGDDQVTVTSCEKDWMNLFDKNGQMPGFKGRKPIVRGTARTFERRPDGSWVSVGEVDDSTICAGV